MIDVYLVEDHKMVAESLSQMIDRSGIARVTGLFHDLESCRQGLAARRCEVLLLDIELPDGDGVDFCVEARRDYPEVKIIMLTHYKEFNIAKHALHNGASGYVLKNADPREFFAGIAAVHRGERFLCEEIDLLLKERKGTKLIWLTNREKQVLRYTAEGCTAKETAERIFLNVESVRSCRKRLFLKLGARNMAELIRKGIEMRLIQTQ